MGLRKQTILNQKDRADYKDSARAVTLAPLPAYTRTVNNITADANGALPAQDGVTLVPGDSLLLDEQTAGADNGVYIVTAVGDGSNPFVLDRRSDFDASEKITAGIRVPVEEGGFGGTVFKLLTADPITINATAIDFDVDSAAGTSIQQGLTWTFDGASQADANPGGGNFRADTVTPSSAAEIYIHPFSASGVALNTLLLAQTAPGFLYLEQVDDPTRWALFDIASTSVAGAGYTKLQVTINGVPPGAEIQDGKEISFAFLVAPVVAGDADAIHNNVASEISAISAKATPIAADFLVIEDSADSNNKKSITMGNIDHDALTNFVANEHIDWTGASAGTIDPTNYVGDDTTVTGLPWSALLRTVSFTAVVGETNRIDGNNTLNVTFPSTPTDGQEFAIKDVANGAGNTISLLVGSGKSWEHVYDRTIGTFNETFSSKQAYAHWRFDSSVDRWTLLDTNVRDSRASTRGYVWEFDANITDIRPGSGQFAFNNAVLNSVTVIYLDVDSANGIALVAGNLTADIFQTDDYVYIEEESDAGSVSAQYKITGPAVSGASYFKIPVTAYGNSGSFTAGFKSHFTVIQQPAYTTIQNEGSPLAKETVLDFAGAGVTATAGSGKTLVTIPGTTVFDLDTGVQTTDATETTLATYASLADDKGIDIYGSIVANNSANGDVKKWKFSLLGRRGTGAASAESLDLDLVPQESTPLTWDVTADDDGAGGLRLRVTGVAATTIDWHVKAFAQESA